MNPNYDKSPAIRISGFENDCWTGWEAITQKIRSAITEKRKAKILLVCELYPGADEAAIYAALRQGLSPDGCFSPRDAMKSEAEIDRLTFPDVTDDRVFGRMTGLLLEDFFDPHKLHVLRQQVEAAQGVVLICGTGASLLAERPDLIIYADMARWEIQLRMRRQEVANFGSNNYTLDFIQKYKRAYFVDWRAADRLKQRNNLS